MKVLRILLAGKCGEEVRIRSSDVRQLLAETHLGGIRLETIIGRGHLLGKRQHILLGSLPVVHQLRRHSCLLCENGQHECCAQ
jgi:hypothetical protein